MFEEDKEGEDKALMAYFLKGKRGQVEESPARDSLEDMGTGPEENDYADDFEEEHEELVKEEDFYRERKAAAVGTN